MCGICGFSWEDKSLIARMAGSIAHRGPDQRGFFVDRRVSMANQRLSIIDLSERGRQPIGNEDGTVFIVYNGELYNYLDIKAGLAKHRFKSDTDTEVILHAYEEYGYGCVRMFNGDFAFAIYDSRKKVIFLARDHVGVKPLYYYDDGKKFIFASELKAILECPEVKRQVNVTALSYALTFRFVPWDDSILAGVKKLLPGHFLVYDLSKSSLSLSKYWDVGISEGDVAHESEDFFAQKIRETFLDSVRRRLMSDVPLGVYLSGGIDSSSILAAMSSLRKPDGQGGPIKTFSVGFGYGEYSDELEHAKRVSDDFATEHHEFIVNSSDAIPEIPRIVWHNDEPISDTAHIPFYFLAKNARKHVTVVLTGEGGDELFAGYEHYKFMPVLDRIRGTGSIGRLAAAAALKVAPGFVLDRFFRYSSALGREAKTRALRALGAGSEMQRYLEIVSIFDDEEKKSLLRPEVLSQMKPLSEKLSPYFSEGDRLNRMLRLEFKTVLPESYLMKGDKMNMAFGVEGRVPILDRRLVELAFSIPPAMKLRLFREKYIFKKALKGLVPEHSLRREKHRFFVPIDRWIKELMPVYEGLLSRQSIERQGYFNYSYVRKALDSYGRSRLFYSRQLWALITFQIWHKLFIENVPYSEIKL